MTDTGWDWFAPKMNDAGGPKTDHWQACFGSDAGQMVLADLERNILKTALGPDHDTARLWMREGQRALVLQIRRLATGMTFQEGTE
ncbi:hypothetical protein LPB41_19855 [Thalassospira sp. MA62]|nr:hypothetical protein [Thalassospira sp. MA62]